MFFTTMGAFEYPPKSCLKPTWMASIERADKVIKQAFKKQNSLQDWHVGVLHVDQQNGIADKYNIFEHWI